MSDPKTRGIKKHPHRLKRHKFRNGEWIYFCTLDDCTFRAKTELVLGKTAQCWRCGNPFPMNEYSVRLMKPHCQDCTKGKKKNQITLEDIGISSEIPTQENPTMHIDSFMEGLRKAMNVPSREINEETEDDLL